MCTYTRIRKQNPRIFVYCRDRSLLISPPVRFSLRSPRLFRRNPFISSPSPPFYPPASIELALYDLTLAEVFFLFLSFLSAFLFLISSFSTGNAGFQEARRRDILSARPTHVTAFLPHVARVDRSLGHYLYCVYRVGRSSDENRARARVFTNHPGNPDTGYFW